MTVTVCATGSIMPVSLYLSFSSADSISVTIFRPESVDDSSDEFNGGALSSSASGIKNSSGVGISNSRQLSRVLAAIVISGSSSEQK